jgi:hypothetical protein
MNPNPDTPHDESPSDEVLVDEQPTRELPTTDTPTGGSPAREEATHEATAPAAAPTATMTATPATPATPVTPAAPAPVPTTPASAGTAEPVYLRGPAPFAIILGLLGLLVAGITLVSELTDLTIPWDDLGPWTVVAAGIVVLLVGAIGLRASRTQD